MSDRTIATFLPLLTSDAHVDELVARLQDPAGYWSAYPVPSVPLEARHFQDHRYWAGPTWVNTNWAIVQAPGSPRPHRARRRPARPHPRAGRRAGLRRVLLPDHRHRPRRARVLVDRRAHHRPRIVRRGLVERGPAGLTNRVELAEHVAHDLVVGERAPVLDGVGQHGGVERARAPASWSVRTRPRSTAPAAARRPRPPPRARRRAPPPARRARATPGWRRRSATTARGWPSHSRGTTCR